MHKKKIQRTQKAAPAEKYVRREGYRRFKCQKFVASQVSLFSSIIVSICHLIFMRNMGNSRLFVEIESGIVIGRFPRRGLGLVLEWCLLRKGELLENWEGATKRLPLNNIAPLE
jgi:hypothetical protein